MNIIEDIIRYSSAHIIKQVFKCYFKQAGITLTKINFSFIRRICLWFSPLYSKANLFSLFLTILPVSTSISSFLFLITFYIIYLNLNCLITHFLKGHALLCYMEVAYFLCSNSHNINCWYIANASKFMTII